MERATKSIKIGNEVSYFVVCGVSKMFHHSMAGTVLPKSINQVIIVIIPKNIWPILFGELTESAKFDWRGHTCSSGDYSSFLSD